MKVETAGAARLGVNVDHVATLRQARRIRYPDPVAAAVVAELAGADNITVHLREDRRHIQDRDVQVLRRIVQTRLNLELAAVPEMVRFALEVRPDSVTLVPERREEVTTEGGLDLRAAFAPVREAVAALVAAGIHTGIFIDADTEQIERARETGANSIEIHTGRYCDAPDDAGMGRELALIRQGAVAAAKLDLEVHAGHGLNLQNAREVAAIPEIVEFNIGHSLVSRAVFVGLERAVSEMKALITAARAAGG
ncbi:MAG: pyridoxine 5'-phosphate synthase [Deltaproteobacteria bacterium]|nr:pyridoxine 5'-phosphate synthase [Deltaproteobacteria bacterium]